MVEFIHKLTGSRMFVAENRVEEYKEAGHKLASIPVTEEKPAKKPASRKKKTTTAKEK